jgi:hypothetical protein
MTTARALNVAVAERRAHTPETAGQISLDSLALSLRHAGAKASARVLGTPVPALAAVLAGLRRRGLLIGAPGIQAACGPLPVLMVMADPQGPRAPQSGLLILAGATGEPVPLLLPAVQAAREAARRMSRVQFDFVLVQRGPDAAGVPMEEMALNFTKIDYNAT